MPNNKDNTLSGIDKYEGSFDQDELGVTMIPTATIKSIKNLEVLGLYTFLASCNSTWRFNAKYLATRFECNKDKIYKLVNSLIEMKLLTRTQIRERGKFIRYHYRLHLRQTVQDTPCLEKPDVDNLDPGNSDTYKTYRSLQSIETATTTAVEEKIEKNQNLSINEVQQELLLHNRKINDSLPDLTDEEFLEACSVDIEDRDKTKYNIGQRIHGICKLMAQGLFEPPAKFSSAKEIKQKNVESKYKIEFQDYLSKLKSAILLKLVDPDTKPHSFNDWMKITYGNEGLCTG